MIDHPFEAYPPGTYHSALSCRRCGRVRDLHPVPRQRPAEAVDRDLAVERLVVARAVAGTALRPEDLEAFAQVRAHPGPVRTLGRNFRREGLEELADGRNYIVWDVAYVLEPAAANGDQEAAAVIPSRLGALRKLYGAWDDLHR